MIRVFRKAGDECCSNCTHWLPVENQEPHGYCSAVMSVNDLMVENGNILFPDDTPFYTLGPLLTRPYFYCIAWEPLELVKK